MQFIICSGASPSVAASCASALLVAAGDLQLKQKANFITVSLNDALGALCAVPSAGKEKIGGMEKNGCTDLNGGKEKHAGMEKNAGKKMHAGNKKKGGIPHSLVMQKHPVTICLH